MASLEPLEWSPSDFREHSFSHVERGYAPEEVQSVLNALAKQIEALVDERARLYEQLSSTDGKQQHLKKVYRRLQERRQHLDDRRDRLDAREQELEEARAQVQRLRAEATEARDALMRIRARLLGVLNREQDALTEASGSTGRDRLSEGGAATSPDASRDVLNSLFPRPLTAGQDVPPEGTDAGASKEGDEANESASPKEGAAAEQFDRIKADLQGAEEASSGSTRSSSPADNESEDEEVSTEELNRIMDVFDDMD